MDITSIVSGILATQDETKQLQILKDLNPNLARVTVLTNPTNAVNAPIVSSIQNAALWLA